MTIIAKRITLALTTGLLTLGTLGCSEERLNPIPKAQISDTVSFDTPARIMLQVNGLYRYVKTGGFLGGRVQVHSDIRANDFINRTNNGVTGLLVWNHTVTEQSQNDVINTWGFGYQAINQINVFLDGLTANTGKYTAPTFPATFAATALGYEGEARFLRALCYYHLLQFYARPFADGNGSRPGLPLRLRGETNNDNNALARSTVAQVYDQILLDLKFAEDNLPLTPAAGIATTRAHRNTAIALRTRVLLTMGRYADVITEANKLVPAVAPFVAPTGVPHALNPSLPAVFTSGTTPENILSFPFTAQDAPGTQNQLAFYFLPPPLGNGEYSLNPGAGGILNDPRWAATDTRRTNFVQSVTSGTPPSTEFYLRKYPTGTPYTDPAPVIRYAEVLLNLAEARVRSTNTVDPQALALLNAVRGRSNGGTYTAASFASSNAMADAILLERRIEFLGEGLRNTDLLRLLQPIPGKSSVGAVNPTDALYIWPIPNTELAANSLMTRN
ncbi:RagB/SusD family nutrient uptake outer membrane protein [Hymenobacter arizonensis]|uniref:Starch-binding associating with outer membrane n=1 Tax=Hymenobacter arizonensis TaxID=1227077 RepID=A0A1I6AW60_HYMAR|nr:RagB/SusD family nutrient uptake outer membrane protein [Hymenobacter arizonensis]SFQ72906.1 Starch-binding associating with outer membrane [Hymenobacter arizonensis]